MSYQDSNSGWAPPQSPPVDAPAQPGAANQGVSMSAVEVKEAESQKRRAGDKDRRLRLLAWVLATVIGIALIVALMVWLWSTDLFVAADLASTAADLADNAVGPGTGR